MEQELFFNKEESLLKEIQDQCNDFAEDIIKLICKRAIRRINSWDVRLSDDYPRKFSNFDILSIERQSKTYDEISPYLEDAVEGALEYEYDRLPDNEKFFVDYSECYYDEGVDPENIQKKIHDRFHDMLNEHYSNSKKIDDFMWRL